MIDTHCHFDFPPFSDDPERALTLAKAAGVKQIVIPSVGQSNWHSIEQLCQHHHELYYGLGIHPFFSAEHTDDVCTQLANALATALKQPNTKCVAVGECGLDFAIAEFDRQQQLLWLAEQLKLANTYHLPVILHCRKAFPELLRAVKADMPSQGGVYHGFSGSYQQASQLLDLGIKIGVGGTITYERAKKTRETIRKLPLSAIVLETDAPDMPVCGFQGEPNRPERLAYIAQSVSLLKGIEIAEVNETTTLTARELFKI
ncbi:TatD family hydrolase [Photobacterium leiognathi]|uniref:TatD family hydrolase n=1 Tax=Photobacterium leiognathi TaxID=553611 RepID=UPI000D1735FC|nr:TatD family hydrolase [Photobacterium leiognathi]PSW56861.1 deoxyribonuclease [Photobacterium leiognathi subsp. mandapamensis]